MPAEAVHLSALEDSRPFLDAEAARALAAHPRAARLGAVLVDLPYFERFPRELARYVLGRPPQPSTWGDRLHREAPSRLGFQLLHAARAMSGPQRAPLLALGLGYVSHCAVDWTLHPLVNRLARARAQRLGSTEGAQHREVEKLQSVIFHTARFGGEFMGSPSLRQHIGVAAGALLVDDGLHEALDRALRTTLGAAPTRAAWRDWSRGYAQYVEVLSSPFGRLIATQSERARERAELYDVPDLPRRHDEAVARSAAYINAAFSAFEAGHDDFDRYRLAIPEGSIDEPPSS